MSAKTTWFWIFLAAGLFAFIFFYHPHTRKIPVGPQRILPNLKAAAVASLRVRPGGTAQLQIRAERTNQVWQLFEPMTYMAQSASIDHLLQFLEQLTPAHYISPAEIRNRSTADEEYGFSSPFTSIFIQQGHERTQLLLGNFTAPGDQVFLQKVGDQGIYVVDVELLKYIPRSVNDWRDKALVDCEHLAFDRIAVTNNGKAFILQRESTNRLWQMVWPLGQAKAVRANNPLIEESLQKLQTMRIAQFVDDEPREFDSFGLVPPDLELALGLGTNNLVLLQFGKSPASDTNLVFARRFDQKSVFTVAKEPLLNWRSSYDSFRDPYLLTLTEPINAIEVHGLDTFELDYQTNDTWRVRVLPEGSGEFPSDVSLIKDLLSALSGLQIIEFVKGVVTAPDLPDYGLASPARRYILKRVCSNSGSSTNVLLAELNFGFRTNQEDRVFARRTDESSVYAVRTNDFAQLPSASWQLRERHLWNFAETNVAQVTILQRGKMRQINAKGPHEWSLAPGSQGIINDLAVDATVRGLAQLTAVAWVGRGEMCRSAFGLTEGQYQIRLDLKNGDKMTIDFGREAPSSNIYASVNLDGQPWVFEFPWLLFRDVSLYLSIPPNL